MAKNEAEKIKTIGIKEFLELLKSQGVPREHLAFRCPMCGTVQSATDLIRAGAGKDYEDVEGFLGFSCVGRWTKAGPSLKGNPPGKGCDWTLGGLLKIRDLDVVTESGERHPRFEPCTPGEAKAHMAGGG